METVGSAQSISPPPARVGPKPWGIREAAAGIALALLSLFVMGGIAVSIVFGITGETEGTAVTAAGIVATIFFDAALVGIAYFFVVHRRRLSWQSLGFKFQPITWWWIPPAGAVTAIVGLLIYNLTVRALGADFLSPEQELDELFDTTALLPLAGVFTVFVAPVTEETFFRGFIFPAFIARFRVWGAMLLAGALFGAAHITSVDTIALIIPIGGIGAFFCWIYYRTGSIWPSIGTHLLFNTVSFIIGVLGTT